MGRHRSRSPKRKRSRSPGKRSFGRFGRFGGGKKQHQQQPQSRFHWHNPKEREREREREKTPQPRPETSQGMFRVDRADGSSYEISKELVKYTKTEPRIAYSTNQLAKTSPAKREPDANQTPQKLLDQLKEQKRCEVTARATPKLNKCPSPPPAENKAPVESPVATKHQFTPKVKPEIVIKLPAAPQQQPPDEKLSSPKAKPSEKKKDSVFDIFGVDEPPKQDKTVPPKLCISVPSLHSLYDDEDEEDFMPTNALRIGSNQIKPTKVNQLLREKKEPKPEPAKSTPTPVAAPPPQPIATPPPVERIEEHKLPPPPLPSPKFSEALQPLDILKSLDPESTEVDDFLQQIQEQRQRIEEKLSSSPKKAPKFSLGIIDIDSVQKEINDKLEQMPDDFPDLPLPGTTENNLDKASIAESSTGTEASSSESSSESDSDTESSESSSSSSESSSSSDSSVTDDDDSAASTSSEDNEENNSLPGTKKTVGHLGIDLTLASRSPVMLKIQQKPRVIPILKVLAEEEEPGIDRPKMDIKEAISSKSRKETQRHEKNDRRERTSSDRRGKRDRLDYGRESSRKHSSRHERSSRREPDLRDRDSHAAGSRKKDRHRSKSRERKSWRSRSTSHSPSPISNRARMPDIRSHDSRSRSRSLSLDRGEGHGRKRSPWRPPIDFWENLNVPTTSWAYNDEQYFSRAYYDESYNYFEQNQVNQHCNAYPNANHEWPHQELANGGGSTSPMRGSLDDRINNVLNGGPTAAAHHPQHLQQQGGGGSYAPCYDGPSGYADYNRSESNYYQNNNNQYENRSGSDQYRQTANLLSISCNEGYPTNNNNTPRRAPQQGHSHVNHVNHAVEPTPPLNFSSSPFALQKGNVIELVPSVMDQNHSSSGYQSEENSRGERRTAASKSAQRKAVREKKRMEKNMRKKKLEMELQSLLDGSPGIEDMIIEGDKAPLTPNKEEVRKVIFSDGVLPGDGTSDSALDTSDDDSNVDLTELTSNQLKKYRKKKRKKRTTVKANVAKVQQQQQQEPPVVVANRDEPVTENGSGADAIGSEDIVEEQAVPLPPPNDPPSHLVQPVLKREVMDRPKKLLYFNSVHRERRMDFFSIFVPFSMFIRLNDPRLLLGHPAIVNRKRIPQPIYPPNMYPPPPQPFQHLPPVQISAITNSPMVVHPGGGGGGIQTPGNDQMPLPVPQTGPIRHIPTIGDN